MYRGELRLDDGESLLWQCSPRPVPAEVKNKKLLVALFLLWLGVTGWFVFEGEVVVALVSIALGGWGIFVTRRQEADAELVEYFVTDRRIVVHTDEDGKFDERVYPWRELPAPTLELHDDGTGTIIFADAEDRRRRRIIHPDRYAERDLKLTTVDHPQRVFEHVQRARHSAEGTSAE